MNVKPGSAVARLIAAAFTTLMLATAPAKAASLSVSYLLDQSNVLSDGVPYLQVTVADGLDGAIDFTVQALDVLTDAACKNFGIQSFAFNVIPGGSAEAGSIGNLPDGWKARNSKRMSEFGFFDIQLAGKGNSRVDTLTFSILGIDGDTPEDYAIASTGNAAGGHQFFAAHVADFKKAQEFFSSLDFSKDGQCGGDHEGPKGGHGKGGKCLSGFFAGSAPVPLPGAAWFFATGAAAVVARARRRRPA